MTNTDKDYATIVSELQAEIDARKEADRIEAIKAATSDKLTELGYKDAQHESALEILAPFTSTYESAEDAEAHALKLHHTLLNVSVGNNFQTNKSIFK